MMSVIWSITDRCTIFRDSHVISIATPYDAPIITMVSTESLRTEKVLSEHFSDFTVKGQAGNVSYEQFIDSNQLYSTFNSVISIKF